jgi:hypothetical protein
MNKFFKTILYITFTLSIFSCGFFNKKSDSDLIQTIIKANRSLQMNASNSEERADATLLLLDSWSDRTKAAPFQAVAHKFVDEADALVKYIIELKARVLAASIDGTENGSLFYNYLDNGHLIDIGDRSLVVSPEEYSNTTNILIGNDSNNPRTGAWSASELHEKLNNFAASAKGIEVTDLRGKCHKLAENTPETKNMIDKMFKFDDSTNLVGDSVSWEVSQFYQTPVAAVIFELTKIENDIILTKNAVLNFLTSQINSADLYVKN